ncbi:RNA ligase [Vibrio phage EniLVp02]
MTQQIEFNKYSSIEAAVKEKNVNRVLGGCDSDTLFCAMEKIHGSNFQFITRDGLNIEVARRRGLLGDENFYGAADVYQALFPAIRNLYKRVGDTLDMEFGTDVTMLQMSVFGELYGRGIQNGIYYCDGKAFAAFDVAVTFYDIRDDQTKTQYLTVQIQRMLCRQVGIPLVPLLATGMTLPTIMEQVPVEFDSILGGIMDNTAEGVVFKAMANSGDIFEPLHSRYGERLILKRVAPKFSGVKNNYKRKVAPVELSDVEKTTLDAVLQYINDNRVNSVISKMSSEEITFKNIGKIAGLVVQDALEEMGVDIDKDVWNAIRRKVIYEATNEAREVIKARMD